MFGSSGSLLTRCGNLLVFVESETNTDVLGIMKF
jgi:hypothetical protein